MNLLELLFDLAHLIWALLSLGIELVSGGWFIYTVWKIGVQGYEVKFLKLSRKEDEKQ